MFYTLEQEPSPPVVSTPNPPGAETQGWGNACCTGLFGTCFSAPVSEEVQLDDAGYTTEPPSDHSQITETVDSPNSPP